MALVHRLGQRIGDAGAGHQTVAHSGSIVRVAGQIALRHAIFDDCAPEERYERGWSDEGRNPDPSAMPLFGPVLKALASASQVGTYELSCETEGFSVDRTVAHSSGFKAFRMAPMSPKEFPYGYMGVVDLIAGSLRFSQRIQLR